MQLKCVGKQNETNVWEEYVHNTHNAQNTLYDCITFRVFVHAFLCMQFSVQKDTYWY